MANEGEIVGLTMVKINGIFRVDVKNSRWGVKRPTPQFDTGGGVRTAFGLERPSGSFDEVIPKKPFNWRALRNFSIEIYEKESLTVIAFSAERCNWGGLDGSSDLSSATTSKAIQWVGEIVNAV